MIKLSNQILLSAYDGSETFAADSTGWIRPGLSDLEWISFEAYARPEHYIGQMFGVVALSPINESSPARARNDATFREVR